MPPPPKAYAQRQAAKSWQTLFADVPAYQLAVGTCSEAEVGSWQGSHATTCEEGEAVAVVGGADWQRQWEPNETPKEKSLVSCFPMHYSLLTEYSLESELKIYLLAHENKTDMV